MLCTQTKVLDVLALALDYPGRVDTAAFTEAVRVIGAAGSDLPSSIRKPLADLADWLRDARPGEAEERYTQLFDLKPVATLNVGYHLFGDTYARGAFLAQMNRENGLAGVDRADDLPDFLPTLLELLATLDDEESQFLLVHSVLIPGLDKIGEALSKSQGPYPELLRALPAWLGELVPAGDREVLIPQTPDEDQKEAAGCSM